MRMMMRLGLDPAGAAATRNNDVSRINPVRSVKAPAGATAKQLGVVPAGATATQYGLRSKTMVQEVSGTGEGWLVVVGLVPAGGTANLKRIVSTSAANVQLVNIIRHVATIMVNDTMLKAAENKHIKKTTDNVRHVKRNAK